MCRKVRAGSTRAFAQQGKFRLRLGKERGGNPGIALDFEDARGGDAHPLVQREGSIQCFLCFIRSRLGVSDGCFPHRDLGRARSIADAIEDGRRRAQPRCAGFHLGRQRLAIERHEQLTCVDMAPFLDQHLFDGAGGSRSDRHCCARAFNAARSSKRLPWCGPWNEQDSRCEGGRRRG